jgi:hypothetical protein
MADENKAPRRKPAGAKRAGRKPQAPRVDAASPSRPKRSRKTLVDDFAAALRADFRAHGAGVIAAVRAEKPDQYLKVVLTLLPKDFSAGNFSAKELSESVDGKTSLGQFSDIVFEVAVRRFKQTPDS